MVDTNRARSALETLFADNTSGDISPQDLRDFLRSVALLNVPNVQTGSTYTLAAADADRLNISDRATAQSIEIPLNATVPIPIGSRFKWLRTGVGLPTFTVEGGVTLRKPTGIRPSRFMGVMAKMSDQTGVNWTVTADRAWDAADAYDTDAFHDPSSTNTRITIPSGLGIKKVELSLQLHITSFTADAFTYAAILKDGSQNYDGSAQAENELGATTADPFTRSHAVPCTDGTYFTGAVGVQTDTSINVTGAQSYFSCHVVEIDPVGSIAYQYGFVTIEKIDTDEWIIEGPALG